MRRIKLQGCTHRENPSEQRVIWSRAVRRAILQDHRSRLSGREERTIVGDVAFDVPHIGRRSQRLRSGSEVKVDIPDIEAGCAVKLTPRILAEVYVQNDLLPGTRAVRWRRCLKVLVGVGKERELKIREQLHDAGLRTRPRH